MHLWNGGCIAIQKGMKLMGRFYAQKTDEVTVLERTNQEIVRALAGECMVLLENDGTLPLGALAGKKIALYGNGADIRSRAEPDRVM